MPPFCLFLIFLSSYKKPHQTKFTQSLDQAFAVCKKVLQQKHSSANAKHGEQYPKHLKDILILYNKFMATKEDEELSLSRLLSVY